MTMTNATTLTHTHRVLLMNGLFTIGVDLEDIGGGLLKHVLQLGGADLCGFRENMISANTP